MKTAFRHLAALTALAALSIAAPAGAQDWRYRDSRRDSGWGVTFRFDYRAGYDYGYRDGREKGERDARKHKRFDVFRHDWYRDGDHHYNKRYGSRERYKDAYRDGFRRGYQAGYRAPW